jgi:hypothetical protein
MTAIDGVARGLAFVIVRLHGIELRQTDSAMFSWACFRGHAFEGTLSSGNSIFQCSGGYYYVR